jgi:hypothetical protein
MKQALYLGKLLTQSGLCFITWEQRQTDEGNYNVGTEANR